MLFRPFISRWGKYTSVSRVRCDLEAVMKISKKYSQVSYIKATAKYVLSGVGHSEVMYGGECQAWTSKSRVVLLFSNILKPSGYFTYQQGLTF